MKVLHILYQSYPNISGSSTRTRDILVNQKKIGLTPVAISSPFQKGVKTNNGSERIDDFVIYRTYSGSQNEEVREESNSLFVKIKKLFRILNFQREIIKVVENEKPLIIHAHAMFFCAYPAIRIGKKKGIPVVYEIRSLWEERRKDSAPNNIFRRFEFHILRKIETYCMIKANHIVAINENLKQDIVGRGIPENKITVIGNGVDIDFVDKQKKLCQPKKSNKITFGYIGSISPIEGLPPLIRLFKEKLIHNKLLIFGNGKESEIKRVINEIGDSENIVYHGSIERNEIYRAYEGIDVIVNPRVKLKITDSVTPLKPLEAMAFGKIVIASDVGGMKELIEDKKTGFLFNAGNINELEKCLLKVQELTSQEKANIISNALNHIRMDRAWLSNAQKYSSVYGKLVAVR